MQTDQGLIVKNNLPVMQDWLVKRITAYNGFDVTNDFSEGIALTAVLELLSNEDINELNDIFYTFNNTPVNQFKAMIENIQKRYFDIVNSAKEEARENLKDAPKHQLNDHLFDVTRKLINQKIANLTQLEKAQLKIRAFIESIELLQSSESISELFQDSDLQSKQQEAMRAISSKKAKSEGGVEKLETLVGFYDVNLLSNYLKELQKAFQNPSIDYTVCLVMNNLNSTIIVAYIPYKGWAYVDSNHLPVKIIKDCDKVASKIIASFGGCDSAFATHVYTTNKNAADCKARLENFKKTSTWNEVNTVTTENAAKADTMGASWLYIAIREGLNDVVNKLLNAADHLDKLPDRGASLLFTAVQKGYIEIVKNLLEMQPEIHPMALMAAAYNNDSKITQLLLDAGADPDQAIDGKTPLMIAAENGHNDVFDVLLESIKNPDQCLLAFFLAVKNGYVEIVNKLLSIGIDPNATLDNGDSALHIAAINNHFDVVKLLLRAKADPNVANGEGLVPLVAAAAAGNFEVVNLLIKTLTDKDQHKFALYFAAHNNHTGIVKALCDFGLKARFGLNHIDETTNGDNPLHLAIANNNKEMVNVLLEAGANSLFANKDGLHPLYVAAMNGFGDIVKDLIAHDAEVDQKTTNDETALLAACQENQTAIVNLLLQSDANPNVVNSVNVSPLLEAVNQSNAEMVNMLIQAGADINFVGPSQLTALYIAAERGYTEIVKMLINSGADLIAKVNATTPADIAKEKGNNEALLLIEKALQNAKVGETSAKADEDTLNKNATNTVGFFKLPGPMNKTEHDQQGMQAFKQNR